ncbi:TPA: hypothetical protein ACKU3G_004040 [Bacillus cereus]|nr:hypothetical protein [Bacillus cereus]
MTFKYLLNDVMISHVKLLTMQRETGKAYLHPYDDVEVMAGQSTTGNRLYSLNLTAPQVKKVFTSFKQNKNDI